MKHQIAIIGGQLLPIYIGIKEFCPDTIHLVVSNQSKDQLNLLLPLLSGKIVLQYTCDAYDFKAIKDLCEKIVSKIGNYDELQFNLTGGTKIMVLAAQAVILEKQIAGFYINPDNTYSDLLSYTKKPILCTVSINEFMKLSGHTSFSYKSISDYNGDDLNCSRKIEAFAETEQSKYKTITTYFRNNFKVNDAQFPVSGVVKVNNIDISWNKNSIVATINGRPLVNFVSKNVKDLFFNAAWWELLVAEEIVKWNKAKEVLIKFELPFKSISSQLKNEIDVLINLGKKLIFVECKSGQIKPEDINKMKIIKETYGGHISKSILVSRFPPNATIIEKCRELDIDIFYPSLGSQKPLLKLINGLDALAKKLSV
ncbi:MAG: DUF1887 family CARF protein [Flavobacterium sp. JAD_PAG50586_2]|nr:MAG: DUF1887 family CARF protein [Flavobacterium sp. JAD_PAG50586_2]